MKDLERNYRYRAPEFAPRGNHLPDLMTPAMPPLELVEAMRKRVTGMRHRRQLRKLLAYDDHTLADIGYSRRDLRHALRLSRRSDIRPGIGNIHQQDMHPERACTRH